MGWMIWSAHPLGGQRRAARALPRSTTPSRFRAMAVSGARPWPLPGPASSFPSAIWNPGNWATDLAGGSAFGYALLSVVLLSNLMAMLLQALSARLGIATGRDLAQACRDSYSRPVVIVLWLLCEVAIAACDLAEVIGAAI